MFRRDLMEMIREETNNIRSQSGPYIEDPIKSGGSSLSNISSGGSTSNDDEVVRTPELSHDFLKVTTVIGKEEGIREQVSDSTSEIRKANLFHFSMYDFTGETKQIPDLKVLTIGEGGEVKEKRELVVGEEGDSIECGEIDSSHKGSGIQSDLIEPIVYSLTPTSSPARESNTSITGVGHNRSRASPTVAFSSIIEWNKSRWERIEGRAWIPDRNHWIWVPMEGRKGGEITKAHVEDSSMAQAQQVILNWPKHEPVILNWLKPTSNLICTFPLPMCSILSTSDERDGWSDDQRRLPPPPLRPPLPSSPPPSPPSSPIEGVVGFKAPIDIIVYLDQFVLFREEKETASTMYKDLRLRHLDEESQSPLTNGKRSLTPSNLDRLQPLRDLTNVESFPKYINSFYTLCKARASIRNTLAGVLNKVFCGSPNETMKEMQIACCVCLSLVDGCATGLLLSSQD